MIFLDHDLNWMHADRRDLGDPLPSLHGRHRVQADDCLQGRAVRLPRLRPHVAPRRARAQVHFRPCLSQSVWCFGLEHQLGNALALGTIL